jgi:hypothetical protein
MQAGAGDRSRISLGTAAAVIDLIAGDPVRHDLTRTMAALARRSWTPRATAMHR